MSFNSVFVDNKRTAKLLNICGPVIFDCKYYFFMTKI